MEYIQFTFMFIFYYIIAPSIIDNLIIFADDGCNAATENFQTNRLYGAVVTFTILTALHITKLYPILSQELPKLEYF